MIDLFGFERKKIMTTQLRSLVRKIVQEEFTKQIQETLQEEESPVASTDVPKRFAKVWATLPKNKWDEFGKWVKTHFGQKVPADLDDKDVVSFIDKNPGSFNMSPVRLVDMFTSMPKIKSGLSAMTDKNFNDIEDEVERRKAQDTGMGVPKYQHGDVSFTAAGEELGVTDAGAKKMADRGQEHIGRFFGGKRPEALNAQEFEALFGQGGKFDAAVDKAADIYTRMLVAAQGDVDKVFASLTAAGAMQAGEDLPADEREAVKYLADLAANGKADLAKEMLVQDIDRNLGEDVIWKSFQNLVARLVRKEMDAADIAAGLKRGRGRPRKVQ